MKPYKNLPIVNILLEVTISDGQLCNIPLYVVGSSFILLVSYTLHSQIFPYHTYNDHMHSSGIQGCQALHGLNLFYGQLM